MWQQKILIISAALVATISEKLDQQDEILPPRPYAFGYAAGRFPGHIDRTHSEVSDGSGVIQGSYSYVDPKLEIRKVDYIADENGFHPILNKNVQSLPDDIPAVAAAKERHLKQYARIANAHHNVNQQSASWPVETKAVENARRRHLSLFERIAQEHARIAAERDALRQAEEIEHPNSLERKYEVR
ncbi:hypothetical protein ABEB36_012447 [Hypothenemus hampei]|uniref:Uncharacterized protein n=1 Tax=Hypothenemus hampei TaxID=57062 RepID=A0ABD1EDY4_HYPHA